MKFRQRVLATSLLFVCAVTLKTSAAAQTPDASRIFYYAPSGICSMKPDGSDRILSAATPVEGRISSAAVSADGRRMVYSVEAESGATELIVANVDGSAATKIKTTPDSILGLDISATGTRILYDDDQDIHSINADGTGDTNLTADVSNDAEDPDFSPDGSSIVFTTREHITRMTSSGAGKQALTAPTSPYVDRDPAFAPSAAQIVFSRRHVTGGVLKAESGEGIYVIAASGGSATQLTQSSLDAAPTYSPDGARIAYVHEAEDQQQSGLYVMSANGSARQQITSPFGTPLAWVSQTGPLSSQPCEGGSVAPSFCDGVSPGDTGPGLVVGTEGDDSLTGTEADDVICGLGGNDTIEALGGNDKISGGDGRDVLHAGDGDDVSYGETGEDALRSGAGADELVGGADDDLLGGGDGNDRLDGGEGSDTAIYLSAPAAINASLADGIATGEGRDQLLGIEDLRGSAFADSLTGSLGENTLAGEGGADAISGGDGADRLTGGAGNDRLRGNAGNDVLSDGAGQNAYFGDEGVDSIFARQSSPESVNCGAAADWAIVDRKDKLSGCEHPYGRAGSGSIPSPGTTTAEPPAVAEEAAPPPSLRAGRALALYYSAARCSADRRQCYVLYSAPVAAQLYSTMRWANSLEDNATALIKACKNSLLKFAFSCSPKGIASVAWANLQQAAIKASLKSAVENYGACWGEYRYLNWRDKLKIRQDEIYSFGPRGRLWHWSTDPYDNPTGLTCHSSGYVAVNGLEPEFP